MLCRDTTGPNTNFYIWNNWDELPYNLLNLVTGPKLLDYIGNKVQENSGRQIKREIKGGQLGEKVGEKLGEKVGEKTGEKVGESLEEIHKLNLCLSFI